MTNTSGQNTHNLLARKLRASALALAKSLFRHTKHASRASVSWLWRNGGGVRPVHRFLKLLEPWGIGLAVFGLLVTLLGLLLDLEDRQSERTFRAWSVILSDDGTKSGSSVRQAMIFLNRKHDGFLCAEWIQKLSNLTSGNNTRECLIPRKERELFYNTDLRGARLKSINLDAAHLQSADLSNASLSGASLVDAIMFDARLTNTSLDLADLQRANLWGSNLSSSSLSYAYFKDAVLADADFKDAVLSNTNLSNANLQNAKNLTQSQLDAACTYLGQPPLNLPVGLKPPTKACLPYRVVAM